LYGLVLLENKDSQSVIPLTKSMPFIILGVYMVVLFVKVIYCSAQAIFRLNIPVDQSGAGMFVCYCVPRATGHQHSPPLVTCQKYLTYHHQKGQYCPVVAYE